MTAGKCPDCGNEYKNIEAHKRFCKSKQKEELSYAEEVNAIDDKVMSQSSSSKVEGTTTDKVLSDVSTPDTTQYPKTWTDKLINKITITKDPMDEYKNFLGKLPKFEVAPPGFFKRMLLKKGLTYKAFVFVDKDGKGEEAYLPYDAAKERVVVDKVGYWPIKVKGDTTFLSKEKLLPLADAPDLSRFQNSANYVWSVYNGGYQEGLSQRFDELMDEMNKERMLKWICLAVAALALIALAVTAYTDGNTIKALVAVNDIQVHQLINLTRVH